MGKGRLEIIGFPEKLTKKVIVINTGRAIYRLKAGPVLYNNPRFDKKASSKKQFAFWVNSQDILSFQIAPKSSEEGAR